MAKRMTIMIIALIIVFGGVFGFDFFRSYMMAKFFKTFQMPPVTISTTKVTSQTWKPFISTVGTLEAVNGVDISPEVSGIIEKIYFNSGATIAKGAPLIKIDDSSDVADLENNVAELKLQKINYQRTADLYKQKATAKSSLDTAQANLTKAQAAVDKSNAIIAYKNIVAPFAGKLGIMQINVGQYISPGNNIVTLQALAPLYVNFSLPEQDLPNIYLNQEVHLMVDTAPGETFIGKVNAINSTVDVNTHNILIQATLPNKDLKLYPGLFANVKVILPNEENVVTVPQTAISYSLFGDSIYVLTADGKKKNKAGKQVYLAKKVYVTTGEQRDNKIVILKGLKVGAQIVTSGQLKLDNDARVVVDNSINMKNIKIENN